MHALHGVSSILELNYGLSESFPPFLRLVSKQINYHVSSPGILVPRVIAIEAYYVQELGQMTGAGIGIDCRCQWTTMGYTTSIINQRSAE